MFRISLYAQRINYLWISKKNRVLISSALLVSGSISSGCAAPARSPSIYPAIERGSSCNIDLEPQLLELRRNNLILSAELRYQKRLVNTLQQSIETIQFPATEPAKREQLQSATTPAAQKDNPILILGRSLVWPVSVYSAWRAVRSLVQP